MAVIGYLVDLPGGPHRVNLNALGRRLIADQLEGIRQRKAAEIGAAALIAAEAEAEAKRAADEAIAERIEKRNKLMAMRAKTAS